MIDVSPFQMETVTGILRRHVPDCEVRAFGSRATWTAKDYSDLDLAVVGKEKLSSKILFALKEDFQESNLPFRVDVLDWNSISKEFRKVIEKNYEVVQKIKGNKQTQISGIPEGWNFVALRNVAKVNEKTIGREYAFDYIEYIDIASVDKGRLLATQKISRNEAPSRAQRIVRDNDILLSTVRPNLKHFAFIQKAEPSLIASTGFAVISAREIDPGYLYYYLTTDKYTNFLVAIADSHTSTYPAFNPDVLENSEIPVPSNAGEQRAIAKILSDLDAKIELNHQMNKTLEQIAQAIFKRWFVDFEFPGYEKTKFVDGLPEGWGVSKISDLVQVLSGFAFKSSGFADDGRYRLVTIKNVQDGYFEGAMTDGLSMLPDKMPEHCKLQNGDILLSLTGNVGRICLVVGENYLLNQRVAKLSPINKIDYGFIYLLFREDKMLTMLENLSSGTAQQNLSPIKAAQISITIPARVVMEQFGKIVNPMFEMILDNLSQNISLSQIRDSLLPRLMSGKIRV